MTLLFKVTATDPSDPNEVGDTDFLAHYAGVNTSMAWAELTPAIRQATEKFVLPYVGTELYSSLATIYVAGTGTDAQKQAIEYLQDCIAHYSVYQVLPEKNLVVASMGAVQNTPSGGSQPASQWSWKAARWAALENGDTFLDRLLNYLEAQVKANVSYFDLWKNSTAYKVKTSDFFRHTSDLDEYLNIQNSRRSFISLVRWMRQVEEDVIAPLICSEQYAALKGTDLDTDSTVLLGKVRQIVAYLGLAEAGPHHRLVIDGDGFRVVSQTDQFDDRRNMTNNVHEGAINSLLERSANRGREKLAELQRFLEKNAVKYPLWANSDCRTKATSKAHTIVQSSNGIGVVGVF